MSLPELTFTQGDLSRADVLVIGLASDGLHEVPESVEAAYAHQFGHSVADLAAALGAKSKAGHHRTLPAAGTGPRLVVVGLGDDELTPEEYRRAAAGGVGYAGSLESGTPLTVVLAFGTTTREQAQAAAEGALLGTYRFAPISSTEPSRSGIAAVEIVHPDLGEDALADEVRIIVEAVTRARDWVNTPANLLYPETFADQAAALAKGTPLSVVILDESALTRGGYGGLLAVGGGSARKPRMVRVTYRPTGATTHLALIGKGITFDSGGLNLKPGDSMYTMKSDMAGAATVLSAVHAIARLGLDVAVTAYAAMAENMPSSTAYRPSDVITLYGGKTIENGNSDAEGRIVMADALARAAEDEPDLIIDIATLTGAALVALGDRTAGLMGNDDELSDQVLDAAESVGEPFWQLPIPAEMRAKLDSSVADLRTTGKDRFGGASVAAAFLREFIPEGTPWAHWDIAGPAFTDSALHGYLSPGGTGFGVRTLIELARRIAI